jgi:type I restriction enzyme M protein
MSILLKEAEIDLDAIAKQLQALEHDSQKTDAIIADFAKSLALFHHLRR